MLKNERVHRYLSKDGTVRVAAVVATDVLEAMRNMQNTSPLSTVALGRALIGSILMASHLKPHEKLGIYLQGSGPFRTIFAEANFEGACRAYIANPHCDLPLKNGKLDVSGGVGIGLLNVVRSHPNQKQPSSGTVHIHSGEIGDDIAFYLSQSHQIPSVVALGVRLTENGKIDVAGGVLIEGMPGVLPETLQKIEQNVLHSKTVSELIKEKPDPTDLMKNYMQGFELEEMEHDYPIVYACNCNPERVHRTLTLLGVKEMDDMIAANKETEIECNFCGKKYLLTVQEIKDLRDDAYKNSLN